ncbi:hypothetical protein Tco_0497174 [Tanacetum coccineum]
MDSIKPRVLAPETLLREIVEEAEVDKPLDRSLAYAFLYTKHSQELLEYVIGTCPKDFNKRDEKHATTPLTKKKQVTFEGQCEMSNNNTHKHVEKQNIQKTNVPVIPSTRVNSCTDASGSQPRSNTKKNKFLSAKSVNEKKVEEHPRTNKYSLKTTNHVDSIISSKRTAEVVATACYTQNRSLIHTRHNKTPYELVHDKKLDLTFLRVFSALCYPTNDSEDLGKLQLIADIRIFVGYAPTKKVPVQVNSVGTPSSTTIDQDAPSPSHSPSSSELQPPISHHGVTAASPIIEDNPFAHFDHDIFVNMFALEPNFEASSSGDVSSAKSTHVTQPHHHLRKWSKDHRLNNVIGNPSQPVSTRKQLATDALWCLYNFVLPKVKPKNFKSAMTEDCLF